MPYSSRKPLRSILFPDLVLDLNRLQPHPIIKCCFSGTGSIGYIFTRNVCEDTMCALPYPSKQRG